MDGDVSPLRHTDADAKADAMIINELGKLIAANKHTEFVSLEVGTLLSYTASSSTAAQSAEVDLEGAGVGTLCLVLDSYALQTPGPTVGDTVLVLNQGQLTVVIGNIS